MLVRAVVVAFLVSVALRNASDRQTHTVALPAERTLSVELTIGELRVLGESRADAVIDVTRSAPSADALTRIPVIVDESATEVRVRGIQADGGTDPRLKTDVTIRVPRDARLPSLRVMEGRIVLTSLSGSVSADLRRGPIEAANVQGSVRLETGIGDVTAVEARLSTTGLLRLRAFNGNVRLALAERPADARVMALALNGTIQSDIPLKSRDTWGPRWSEATLGKGAAVISLDVVTGRIEIRSP